MAFPIILIALFVFATILFGISRYQRNQTRLTAQAIEKHKAFILADAGLARAMARHIARPYANRWYGSSPRDDQIAGDDHAGRFDESSQNLDQIGSASPLSSDQKLEPRGTYSVLVEDRHVGSPEPPAETSNLNYTDIFSKGTVEGSGGSVSALLFARVAIAPEVNYGAPDASAPENIKKIIRYKAYFDDEVVDVPYDQAGAQTRTVRERIDEVIARYHINFLKNRDAFEDLRNQVNAGWNATASKITYSTEEVLAFFNGMRPIRTDVPPSRRPDDADGDGNADRGEAFNLWGDNMLRIYQISDLVGPDRGFRYVIDEGDIPDGPEADKVQRENAIRNILHIFHGITLDPIPDEFRPDSPEPVTSGSDLIDLQGPTQANVDQPAIDYQTNISHFQRVEAFADIVKGNFSVFPTPATTPPVPGAGTSYVNQTFVDMFLGANCPENVEDLMRSEVNRLNTMLAGTQTIDASNYIKKYPPSEAKYPIQLRRDPPPGASQPGEQIPVSELMKFYYKYIDSSCEFAGGNTVDPGPPFVPPDGPDPNPTPGSGGGSDNGGGNNGGGGSLVGPGRIGGGASGI